MQRELRFTALACAGLATLGLASPAAAHVVRRRQVLRLEHWDLAGPSASVRARLGLA
jgi:hypothetical protein